MTKTPSDGTLIAIAVCTYRRPQGLARCLTGLEHLDTPGVPDAAIRIIVVDNSPEGSAAEIIAGHAQTSRYEVTHVHEPRKGLSRARNAVLDAAFACDAARLAFVDDDEVPAPAWLAAHLETLASIGAQASVGPVSPIFAEPPPLWAVEGGFFAEDATPQTRFAREGRTNNTLVDCRALAREEIRFDPAFDDLGGEDTAFFRTLQARGWQIAVAHEALVYEWVPRERMRVSWLARRWFRTGSVEARLSARGHRGAAGRAANAARGLARIGGGGALLIGDAVATRKRSRLVARLFTLCRGGGLIASAFGMEHREYAAPRAEEARR